MRPSLGKRRSEEGVMGSWKVGWKVGETPGSSLYSVGEDVNLLAQIRAHTSECF